MPLCGGVARSTRYSAPRTPGYAGRPRPTSLMGERGAARDWSGDCMGKSRTRLARPPISSHNGGP